MADQAALRTRLKENYMPGQLDSQLDSWLTEAVTMHGYSLFDDVPTKAETTIVLYARYLGLSFKAADTAEDGTIGIAGEISIGKSGSSGNYDKQISRAWTDYTRSAAMAGLTRVSAGVAASGSFIRADEEETS